MSVPILQRRHRDAHRNLSAPAGNKIALSARALLPRRMGSPHEVDQPWLALEYLLKRLGDGGRRRDLGDDFRRFVKESDPTVGVDGDDAIIEIGEDLLPGYLRCCASLWLARCLHNHQKNQSKIITDTGGGAMVGRPAGLALATFPMVQIFYTLGVYTRSGQCPLFLFLGPKDGPNRRPHLATGRTIGRN